MGEPAPFLAVPGARWLRTCLAGVAPVGASLQDLPPGRVIRIDPRVGLTSLTRDVADLRRFHALLI